MKNEREIITKLLYNLTIYMFIVLYSFKFDLNELI